MSLLGVKELLTLEDYGGFLWAKTWLDWGRVWARTIVRMGQEGSTDIWQSCSSNLKSHPTTGEYKEYTSLSHNNGYKYPDNTTSSLIHCNIKSRKTMLALGQLLKNDQINCKMLCQVFLYFFPLFKTFSSVKMNEICSSTFFLVPWGDTILA